MTIFILTFSTTSFYCFTLTGGTFHICPQKMVTSTAFATCLGWSVSPGMHWSVSPGMGGQLAPECGGQVQQNLH